MKVKMTYPVVTKYKLRRSQLIEVLRWPFIVAAVICPVMNLLTGGTSWSLIVLPALYMVWSFVVSPDLVEVNRISQFIKLVVWSCILLFAISITIHWERAVEIIPSVCFFGLIVTAILFFTDLERQKQNMLPMILLIFISIVSSAIGLAVWHEESRWAFAVMGVLALILLIACMVVLGNDFKRELQRRFHSK